MNKLFKLLLSTMLIISQTACSSVKVITLTPENTLFLRGEINKDIVSEAAKKYVDLRTKSAEMIYLVIDSPGGSVIDGIDLINFLKLDTKLNVVCLNCASMAYMIFEILPGERLITEYSRLMSHRASAGFQGQINEGELESRLNHIKSIINYMESAVASRIGISLKDYKANIVNEWWSFGHEAIANNSADKIVNLQCSPELAKQKEIKTFNTLFGQFKEEYSACPVMP